jgi:dihydroxyacetone kinase-like predicted kinase
MVVANYLNPERKYTEKQIAFLDAMAGPAKGNINQAIKMAGYGEVAQRDVIGPLQDELIAIAEHILAYNAPMAAFGLTNVVDDPTMLGAKNAVAAAKEVLDRVGVVKKEKIEVSSESGGIFILPPKHDESND